MRLTSNGHGVTGLEVNARRPRGYKPCTEAPMKEVGDGVTALRMFKVASATLVREDIAKDS